MKENVEKSIAAKEETIIEVELTTIQKQYYRAIYEKNFHFLSKGTKGPINIVSDIPNDHRCKCPKFIEYYDGTP